MPRLLLVLVASAALLSPAMAQAPIRAQPAAPAAKKSQVPETPTYPGLFRPDPLPATEAARLLKEIEEHQQAVSNLEEMCDTIGPRLTGSQKLRDAQKWAMEKLKSYGAVNVHEEPYAFGRAWTRGEDHARLLNGNGQLLRVDQMAWTPGTQGKVKGEVVVLEAETLAELKAMLGHLEGHIVLMGKLPKVNWQDPAARDEFRGVMAKFKEEHPLVMLLSSEKKADAMNMGGSPLKEEMGGMGSLPAAFIANEHAELLKRLVHHGLKPELEVQLGGTFSEQPVMAYNVIGEIRGSEKPEEVVLVGGHQDSWDLGTGATDNGTGTVAAMEVLRAIKAAGIQPKRTIRAVLFSGEEQGLMGSQAYAKAHADELKNFQAVLIDDLGTGRIKGWTMEGREADCQGLLGQAMAGANGIGCRELLPATIPGASDHWPFEQQGVPAFFAYQEFEDYFTHTHHSQLDTFDHVVPEDLVQGTEAMAVTALGLADLPVRLPHQAAKPAPERTPAKK
ncbi:MAG TPA: M20/M25/M40 family metallo-hydrolase [Holophagaceae bacterium]|nr:M20/M25/M40 family metallo-hydrolase [Holophagaceae bacterium]